MLAFNQTDIERAALALANYDAAMVDAPQLASIEDFRLDVERQDYLGRARAALEAVSASTVVQAIADLQPITVIDGQDYAQVTFGDGARHSTQAMTKNPEAWRAIASRISEGHMPCQSL